jgi:hypothetical protein
VTDCSLDPLPIGSLLPDPSGDVRAARRGARQLLGTVAQPHESPGDFALATLVLTAAGLHLEARIGPEPTLADLRGLLRKLAAGPDAWAELASSPIQFVQYAAAEFTDAVPAAFVRGISLAIEAVQAWRL